jgi:hypothetical protein
MRQVVIIELTSQRVLSHEYANDANICMACPCAPPLTTRNSCIVNERAEHELSRLVGWSASKDGYNQGCRSNSMPPDGDIVEVL